jgi:hypothetical protein
MASSVREPRLSDVLKDPIVRTLMRRDAVGEAALLEVIDDARRRIAPEPELLPGETEESQLLEA